MVEVAEQVIWLSSRVRWQSQTTPSPSDKVALAGRTSRPEVLGRNQDLRLLGSIYGVLEEAEAQQTGLLLAEAEGVEAAVLRD